MRTYFLTFILCLFATNISFAQEEDFNHLVSKYSKNFLGTWKYEAEGYSIRITFTKGIFAGYEHIFGTYQIQMNGRQYEDIDEKNIMGMPNRFKPIEVGSKFNPNEIIFQFFDRKYFNGSNDYALSQFKLTMQKGRTDRAVLRMVPEGDPLASKRRPFLRPTQNLFPPDGTVLIKQK